MTDTIKDRRHGGPYDRGRADAYYGRDSSPHKYEGATTVTPRVETLTPEEVREYYAGYDSQTDRKEWEL